MSWGKLFASMYTGSLFGKPALVFAIWTYAIANMRPSKKDAECYVEMNATLLAAMFAATVEAVLEALGVLEAPDPASRTKTDDGRRLVLLEGPRHCGPMQYRVVNGAMYRAMRDEEERREQNRNAKRAERERKRGANVSNVSHGQPPSSQAEADAEVRSQKSEEESKAGAQGAPSLRSVSPSASAEPKATRKKRSESVGHDAPEYVAAVVFEEAIRRNDPKFVLTETKRQAWARQLAPQIRQRGFDDVITAIKYAQNDSRERKYTRSPVSLEKNFPGIVMAMASHASAKGGADGRFNSHFQDR